ncbi:glycosyltransferase [Ligilactobacillus animalis]|uniref:Glycosyltransferase n=1 Tax=Ligilactobacillus animalis TaxID=1605 RepID=A0AAJ6K4X3_9LACO|nr:glycosyltransferase [Ligilactobacillus animalis]KDA46835.1 poly-beta-1,6 N-acetyl-D-glucosamine synthase, pgaC [Ligilactobacillus animalis]MDQ2233313.1 glycosyltransferase [Ligilactobacillus animalis]MEE0260299.1 glycosyltransferase [Ligilactobacillus animalis]PNQ53308.1 glycosyl transferase family 2 [Ligilactobacillus animalis]WHQ80273.1 glycosyltransferase [Ligilactobacillus animalis]
MKISVVVSVFNGEKYISEQLDSLRHQIRRPDEVLLFDDGSSDKTPQIVTDYITKYSLANWKYTRNPENKGWRRNFMEGMWAASGDLVFSCDQDDIWHQDKLKIMSEVMENSPQISLLTSNYELFFEDGSHKDGFKQNDGSVSQIPLKNNYLLVGRPGCTHCIRKELLDIARKYWRPEYPHDALLWRLSLFSDGLYNYNGNLIRWRKHQNSAFTKESRDLKSVAAKKKWIQTARAFDDTLREYVNSSEIADKTTKLRVLDRNDRWLAVRERFYLRKNPLVGVKLATYWDCFPRYRQYLGDWYLIYLKH